MPAYDDDLRLAHVLADAADSTTMTRFRAQDLRVESKPDLTPVTDADRTVEEAIRSTLKRARPRDAITGEEYGESGHGPRRWVIDPIDGTKNFVRGVPVWATLIALMDGEDVVAGVVLRTRSRPPLVGGRGHRCLHRQEPVRPRAGWRSRRSRTSTDASLSYSSYQGWEDRGCGYAFLDLTKTVWRSRAYGDFWSYILVAEGAVDVACEPEVNLYDLAAVAIIVEEAGGRFTDIAGNRGPGGGSAVATNGALHDDVIKRLAAGAAS